MHAAKGEFCMFSYSGFVSQTSKGNQREQESWAIPVGMERRSSFFTQFLVLFVKTSAA